MSSAAVDAASRAAVRGTACQRVRAMSVPPEDGGSVHEDAGAIMRHRGACVHTTDTQEDDSFLLHVQFPVRTDN